MVDEAGPAPYVPVEPANPHPALLRHSPFNIGFFGALGALVAIFLSQQLLSISSILVLLVMSMFLAIGLNPVVEFFMRRGMRRGAVGAARARRRDRRARPLRGGASRR